MSSEQFQLVLEGFTENSSDTLRRVKGALLSDLGLTVSEAQAVLDSLPFTIFSSTDEGALSELHQILSMAGARVLVIRPGAANPQPIEESLDFLLQSEPTSAPSRAPTAETAILETGLDFFVTPSNGPQVPQPVESVLSDSSDFRGDFSLELAAPPELPPLKEALVEEAPLLEPLEPQHQEAPTTVCDSPSESTFDSAVAPPRPEAEVKATLQPTPPRSVESPHNVPLGRRMQESRRTADGSNAPLIAHENTTALKSRAALTRDTIGLIVGGTLLLGALNWIAYRL